MRITLGEPGIDRAGTVEAGGEKMVYIVLALTMMKKKPRI